MVSKRIASLDAWLARAEEVLTDQRDHAISPSEGVEWDPNQELTTISLATLSAGLPSLVSALCTRPGRWILIVEENAGRALASPSLRGRVPDCRGGVEQLPAAK